MVKAFRYRPYIMHDPFVTCPYNAVHQVPLSRLQQHLVKCQWRHVHLLVCPYNATHRYSWGAMTEHVKDCPSKPPVNPEDHPPRYPISYASMLREVARNCKDDSDPEEESPQDN